MEPTLNTDTHGQEGRNQTHSSQSRRERGEGFGK